MKLPKASKNTVYAHLRFEKYRGLRSLVMINNSLDCWGGTHEYTKCLNNREDYGQFISGQQLLVRFDKRGKSGKGVILNDSLPCCIPDSWEYYKRTVKVIKGAKT